MTDKEKLEKIYELCLFSTCNKNELAKQIIQVVLTKKKYTYKGEYEND